MLPIVPKKIGNKDQEPPMTVVQTILVGLTAAFVGFYFQFRSWRHQNFEKIRSSERSAAISLIADLSNAIDNRITLQRRFVASIFSERNEEDDLAYRRMLDTWNAEHSSRFAKTQHLFDRSFAEGFQRSVHSPLQQNNAIAERAMRLGVERLSKAHRKETATVSARLSVVQHGVKGWLMEANTRVANGELSQTRNINNIYCNDPDMLTRTYLIRRLLNLSVSKL